MKSTGVSYRKSTRIGVRVTIENTFIVLSGIVNETLILSSFLGGGVE